MRRVFLTILSICAASAVGCDRQGDQFAPPPGADTVVHLSHAHVVQFVNASGQTRTMELTYIRDIQTLGATDLSAARAGVPGAREHRWLLAYMNHAALEIANGQPPAHYVAVVQDDRRGGSGGRWFFAGAEEMYWCPDSLAVRSFGTVVTFTEDEPPQGAAWIPLTPQSYRLWHSALEARVNLPRRFGPPPGMNQIVE